MLLFVNSNEGLHLQHVIPISRIFQIIRVDDCINVEFDNGEVVEMENGSYQKKVNVASVRYGSPDLANKAMRQFYKACRANANVFMFSKEFTELNSVKNDVDLINTFFS